MRPLKLRPGPATRATSAVGIINACEARDAVAGFIGYYDCYAKAPAAAFIGGGEAEG